jgi:hypothetical protein
MTQAGRPREARKHFETALLFDKGCQEAIGQLSTSTPQGDIGAAMFDRILAQEETA